MKKTQLIIINILCLIFISCATYQYPKDITSQYKGKVKSIISISYQYDAKTLKKIKKEYTSKYIVEYDRQGRKISSWSYKNGRKSWGSNTTFSKGGKKVITIFKNKSKTTKHEYALTFNKDKKLIRSDVKSGGTVIHTYDENGNKIAKTDYDAKGKRKDSTYYHFDSKNNNIKIDFFDKKGQSAAIYMYDNNGFKTQYYHINKKGKPGWFTKYKNDQFGNRTDHFSYTVKGKDTILKSHGKHFYTYDKYNNVIKDSAVYKNEDYISVTKDIFTYWN
ncbi:hypothetical protein [Kordia sp.]|uniref:hypothetical protein n=1 Tax=Kordia sp. TaxID=1965332 RepID=UPI003D6BAD28